MLKGFIVWISLFRLFKGMRRVTCIELKPSENVHSIYIS